MLTYQILSREGPTEQTENLAGDPTQVVRRYWRFTASCTFHPACHTILVTDPYTAAQVKNAVETACKSAYQSDPSIGQSWSAIVGSSS